MENHKEFGVRLIGCGFIGRTHAFAFSNVYRVFDPPVKVPPVMLTDIVNGAGSKRSHGLATLNRSTTTKLGLLGRFERAKCNVGYIVLFHKIDEVRLELPRMRMGELIGAIGSGWAQGGAAAHHRARLRLWQLRVASFR